MLTDHADGSEYPQQDIAEDRPLLSELCVGEKAYNDHEDGEVLKLAVNEGEKISCYTGEGKSRQAKVQCLKGAQEVEPDGGIRITLGGGVYVFPVNDEFGDALHVLYVIVTVQH